MVARFPARGQFLIAQWGQPRLYCANLMNLRTLSLPSCLVLTTLVCAGEVPRSLVFSGDIQNPNDLTFVNSVVGWDLFYNSGFLGESTVIGNVEAGHIWAGHEAFDRFPGVTNSVSNYHNTALGAVNEIDYHATAVGHVLTGSGHLPTPSGESYSLVGVGMAPEATVVSGAIATGFSSSDFGSFSITHESAVNVYKAFFQGVGAPKSDVINSSWGGGDTAGAGSLTVALDGLARENSTVALVVSAGNGGNDAVAAPASGYNNISVGSVGGPTFLQPSSFSSRGASDFHNPQTGVTLTGVRSSVDIAAPGERMFLAAYLGDSGSIGVGLPSLVQEPSPTNLYFQELDGTSFSSPMVAGGIALLKDAGNVFLGGVASAMDTRVIKSVIMAGARETAGWNNGQNAMNVTTQGLDAVTGAGSLDLVAAADVYYYGTTDVLIEGETIADTGWDSATIDLGDAFEYVFNTTFTETMALTVALNWFSVRDFDDQTGLGGDIAFANLDLQVWSVDGGGQFLAKVGESMTTYNNSEFLRIDALDAGRYGLRVFYGSNIYDTSGLVDSEDFGIAWRALAIPEPGVAVGVLAGLVLVIRRRREV